ncbi:MAG TPA: sulfurtransferase [Longimicrobium sp.]|jgi:thiosulfate/3-mercaptopyruvate sulfurtransferase
MLSCTALLLALAVAPHADASAFSRVDPACEEPQAQAEMLVSTAWLARHADDPDLVILHVGDGRAEYDRGHVPGARLLLWSDFVTDEGGASAELPSPRQVEAAFEAAGVSDGSRVVIYGHPIAAARAWATLDWLGHGGHASVLDGGLEVWRAEGRPVSREAPRPRRGSLTARVRPERFVDADWVRSHLGDPRHALVDARPAAEFTGGDGGHGGMHAAGHIPGARNLYWEELIVSRDRPAFRGRDELRALFRRAGADPGDTVVTYCMVGMRASVTYFVARLLGYETRFYDGSWVDWSRRGLPVESGAGARAEGRR